jgi:hypothetical protein
VGQSTTLFSLPRTQATLLLDIINMPNRQGSQGKCCPSPIMKITKEVEVTWDRATRKSHTNINNNNKTSRRREISLSLSSRNRIARNQALAKSLMCINLNNTRKPPPDNYTKKPPPDLSNRLTNLSRTQLSSLFRPSNRKLTLGPTPMLSSTNSWTS